jgi:hypothetical protein
MRGRSDGHIPSASRPVPSRAACGSRCSACWARRWPEEDAAGSTFAVQVTSDIPGAQQMTMEFANNNLNGKSRWRAGEFRDYDSSRTRVCVTVGMMTTG